LRRDGLRLICWCRLRTTLEEYFVEKLRKPEKNDGSDCMNAQSDTLPSTHFRESRSRRVLYNLIAFTFCYRARCDPGGARSRAWRRLVVVNMDLTAGIALSGSWIAFFIGIQAGLERDREAHALHGAVAASGGAGVHRREVLRTGRTLVVNTFSWPSSICGAAVCGPQIQKPDGWILVGCISSSCSSGHFAISHVFRRFRPLLSACFAFSLFVIWQLRPKTCDGFCRHYNGLNAMGWRRGSFMSCPTSLR